MHQWRSSVWTRDRDPRMQAKILSIGDISIKDGPWLSYLYGLPLLSVFSIPCQKTQIVPVWILSAIRILSEFLWKLYSMSFTLSVICPLMPRLDRSGRLGSTRSWIYTKFNISPKTCSVTMFYNNYDSYLNSFNVLNHPLFINSHSTW